MSFDPWTLWIVVLLVGLALSAVMLFGWWLTPSETALGYWALGIFLLVAGLGLGLARPLLDPLLPLLLGNSAILAAYGLLWSGLRRFDGLYPRLPLAFAPAALWPLLCLVPQFRDSLLVRFTALSLLICVLLVLAIHQLWRGNAGRLRARRAALGLAIGMLLLNLARLPMSETLTKNGEIALFANPHFAWFALAGVACIVFLSFVLIVMVRERSESHFRSASMLDELTGLLNRRGFLREAAVSVPPQGPCALLMLDLDRFKQVNDRFGHAEGDRVIAAFAKVLRESLRQLDVTGRIGGEEFGVLLPGLSLSEAGRAAERVRRAFLEAAATLRLAQADGIVVPVSVSIGVSATDRTTGAAGALVTALMKQADRELYRAKSNGRNRVELAVFDPGQIDSVA